MNSTIKWLIPLLITVGIAVNGFTVNWINSKFESHANRPHVGTATHEEYLLLRGDLKEMQEKLDHLVTQVVRLQVILIEAGPK